MAELPLLLRLRLLTGEGPALDIAQMVLAGCLGMPDLPGCSRAGGTVPSPGEVLLASSQDPIPQAQPHHLPASSPVSHRLCGLHHPLWIRLCTVTLNWAGRFSQGQHTMCMLRKVNPSALTCELSCCQVLCSC